MTSPSWTGESKAVSQTHALGAAIGRAAKAGDLIALVGELGAGKTQLVRGLAAGMGIDPQQVSSPTFVMMQEYESVASDGPVLVHIDAYRVSSLAELETIGWEGDAASLREGAAVVVEWADRITDYLGDDRLEIMIEHEEGERRQITIEAFGVWVERLEELRKVLSESCS